MVHLSGDVNRLKNKLAYYEAQLRMKTRHYTPSVKRQRTSAYAGPGFYEQIDSAELTKQTDPALSDPEVLVLMAAVWELRREICRMQDSSEVS